MFKLKIAALSALCVAGLIGTTQAKPFDAKSVNEDAKWVLHVDVDALSKTDTWKLIQPKLMNNPQFADAKAKIERVGQVKLPDDLHDVTIFGRSFGEQEAVVVINATVNAERLKTLLSLNETYTTASTGGYTVHTWEDKGRNMHAAFANDGRIVISQSSNAVVGAMDTISGKSNPMKNPVLMPKQADAGVLMYVAGDQIAELAKLRAARSPVVQQLQSAWLTVTETDKALSVTSEIAADAPEVAEKVKQAIDGVKAMVSFAGQDDPDAMLVSDAILDLSATVEGKNVNVKWNIPTSSVSDLLNRVTGEVSRKVE